MLGLGPGLGPVPPWLLLASVKCRCLEVSPAPSLLRRFHWETGVWQPRAVTLGWIECGGGWSASILPRSPLQPLPGPVLSFLRAGRGCAGAPSAPCSQTPPLHLLLPRSSRELSPWRDRQLLEGSASGRAHFPLVSVNANCSFFPFGTEKGCAPAVKSCARRKSDLARPGIFFVEDLKTCSQLALLILEDSDTFD